MNHEEALKVAKLKMNSKGFVEVPELAMSFTVNEYANMITGMDEGVQEDTKNAAIKRAEKAIKEAASPIPEQSNEELARIFQMESNDIAEIKEATEVGIQKAMKDAAKGLKEAKEAQESQESQEAKGDA